MPSRPFGPPNQSRRCATVSWNTPPPPHGKLRRPAAPRGRAPRPHGHAELLSDSEGESYSEDEGFAPEEGGIDGKGATGGQEGGGGMRQGVRLMLPMTHNTSQSAIKEMTTPLVWTIRATYRQIRSLCALRSASHATKNPWLTGSSTIIFASRISFGSSKHGSKPRLPEMRQHSTLRSTGPQRILQRYQAEKVAISLKALELEAPPLGAARGRTENQGE